MTDKIKAVVFDMDGVLFDTERLFMESWKAIAAERQVAYIEKAAAGSIGLNVRDTKALFLREYGPDFPFEEYYEACGKHFRDRVDREGLPLKPGVMELLASLRAGGYRIALASSSSRRSVMSHLDRAGITGFFEVIVGGDMIEHGKPAPDIYLKACDGLAVSPGEAVAVEDSPNGLRSAHAAGLKPIMVPDLIAPTPETERLLYAECGSLFEVMELLMKLDGRLQETVRIELEGLCNTRDLGGYRSADGRRIKERRLIRSGALYDATGADRERLVSEYGLKTIVDFRTEAERNLKPDPSLPDVTYIANPILDEKALGITREEEGAKESSAVVSKVVAAISRNGSTPLAYMKNMYRKLIADPFSRAQYRKFFDILLSGRDGAVLWHCSAGKDRVGVGTILLLSALDIPREQIMADYMKVNEFGKKDVEVLMSTLAEHVDTDSPEGRGQAEAVRMLFMVDRAYAESVFREMEQEHGSVDAFLEKEMGLTPEKRAQLKDMYLE